MEMAKFLLSYYSSKFPILTVRLYGKLYSYKILRLMLQKSEYVGKQE